MNAKAINNILLSDPEVIILKGEAKNLLQDISDSCLAVITVGEKSRLADKVRHKVILDTLERECSAKHAYAKKLIAQKAGAKLPRGFIKAKVNSRERIIVLDADTIPRVLTTEELASRYL